MSELPIWISSDIAQHMEAIQAHFKDNARLTLLVRTPDCPDGSRDMVLTDDDLAGAIAALEIVRVQQVQAMSTDGNA